VAEALTQDPSEISGALWRGWGTVDPDRPVHEAPDHPMPGDIVMFQGRGWVPWAIRRFDECDVDHTAIVLDPETVVSTTVSGVRPSPLGVGIADSVFADVRRLTRTVDMTPIVSSVRRFATDGPNWVDQPVVTLAMLGLMRRLPLHEPTLRRLLVAVLDRAATLVSRLAASGARPISDAEFVRRCYAAGGTDAAIEVLFLTEVAAPAVHRQAPVLVGRDAMLWVWAAGRPDPPPVEPTSVRRDLDPLISSFARVDDPGSAVFHSLPSHEETSLPIPVTDEELHGSAVRFRDQILALYGRPIPGLDPWGAFRAAAGHLTAADLRYSPSLRSAGTLRPSAVAR